MSRTATYHTTVRWTGEHWGHVEMGNGPEMKFSAPPDAQGHAGVLTPEDAFVAAANSCVMMMFLWATERFRLNLLSFECWTERRSSPACISGRLFGLHAEMRAKKLYKQELCGRSKLLRSTASSRTP